MPKSERSLMFREALLEITKACPLSCKHCYLGGKVTKDLPVKDWFRIIDKLRDEYNTKKVCLLGGEPTMYIGFYEILQYCIDSGFKTVAVETSGVTETKLNDYDCDVIVSFESHDKKKNDEIRRGRGFDSVYDRAVSKVRTLSNVGKRVWVRYCIYRDSDAEAMVKFAESIGANSVGVPLKPVGSAYENMSNRVPSTKRLGEHFLTVARLNEMMPHEHVVDDPVYFLFHPDLKKRYERIFLDRSRVCPAGLSRIFISNSGRCSPCEFLTQFNMGNILKHKKETVYGNFDRWNLKIRDMPAEGKCVNCKYKPLCNGSCVVSYINNKSKRGLFCPFYS